LLRRKAQVQARKKRADRGGAGQPP
jgi:hypothetical protein